MVAVPAAMPEITPDDDPAVAMVVLLLVHDPPAVPSLSVVVCPAHTLVIPVMAAGAELTDIIILDRHP